MVKKGLATSS